MLIASLVNITPPPCLLLKNFETADNIELNPTPNIPSHIHYIDHSQILMHALSIIPTFHN